MGRFEILKGVGAPLMVGGGFVAGAAFVVEFLGYEPSEPTPEAFNWIEGTGGIMFAVGTVALIAYKVLNPSWHDDDQDHWRDGY